MTSFTILNTQNHTQETLTEKELLNYCNAQIDKKGLDYDVLAESTDAAAFFETHLCRSWEKLVRN